MEFKKFSVRVINDVGGPISIGMNISLINKEPRILSDIGVIETYEKDYSGFSYGIRNFGSDKISFHHISSIRPISPILVDRCVVYPNDIIYYDDELHMVKTIGINISTTYCSVETMNGRLLSMHEVRKVIVMSAHIGYIFYDGIPHDHCIDWRDGIYLEEATNRSIGRLLHKGYVSVMVEKLGGNIIPRLVNGKVILDICETKK